MAQIANPPVDGQERLLEHVLRILRPAAHPHTEPVDTVPEPLHEPIERPRLVSLNGAKDLFVHFARARVDIGLVSVRRPVHGVLWLDDAI